MRTAWLESNLHHLTGLLSRDVPVTGMLQIPQSPAVSLSCNDTPRACDRNTTGLEGSPRVPATPFPLQHHFRSPAVLNQIHHHLTARRRSSADCLHRWTSTAHYLRPFRLCSLVPDAAVYPHSCD